MHSNPLSRAPLWCSLSLAFSLIGCAPPETGDPSQPAAPAGSYEALVELFAEWRAFEAPRAVDGVPDYSVANMASQHRELADYRARLDSIDTSTWTVSHKIDHRLLRAEMNGLDFDHRVRRPWAKIPAFYVTVFPAQSDVPAHEGPVIHGWVDLWTYNYPLGASDAAELAERLGTIPRLLEHARVNLVGDGRDLWLGGIRAMANQRDDLDAFGAKVFGTSPSLDQAVIAARESTEAFHAWLLEELPSKTGISGIGKDNYTWLLQNVHLVPYTWDEMVTLMRHELSRSHAALALEEHRNRALPPLARIDNEADYEKRFNDSVTELLSFLAEEEIVSVRDYADPALRAKLGTYTSATGLRGFFNEISYRDPVAMRTHSYHWVELAAMENAPHASPIRRIPSLFNIFDARSEGLATGMEEWLMLAGLFDDNPRARELIYIMLAQRAARALGGLMMHGGEADIEQASELASSWTPRGWMPANSNTVLGEQHLYLAQPGYGTSYLIGKIQIEGLLAERRRQLGDAFTIRGFMDEFSAAGVIPVSLVRWELTGEEDPILRLSDVPGVSDR